ncbi:MAG: hypothetical protein WB816_10640 [Methylocystis sp.]
MGDEPGGFEKSANVVERVLAWLGALPKIALSILFVWLIVVNFSAISSGVGGLAKRLRWAQKVSVLGASAEWSAGGITDSIKSSNVLGESDRNAWHANNSEDAVNSVKLLKASDKQALMRLMYVGVLDNLCRFTKPTAAMQAAYGIDHVLAGDGLVTIEPNEKTKKEVESRIRKRENAPDGKPSDIGYPTECYDLKLTSKGADARTVITHELVDEFGAASPADNAQN